MSDLRTAAQQALEALECGDTVFYPQTKTAIAALRAALAEPVQEPEPAGWFEAPFGEFRANPLHRIAWPAQTVAWSIPLYLAPPQRKPEPMALDWLHKWANQDDGEPETQWHEGYEAARRVVQIHLTTPLPRKPLTQEEIPALAEKAWTPSVYCDAEALLGTDGLVALVRAVEAKRPSCGAAHGAAGVTEARQPGPPWAVATSEVLAGWWSERPR